MDFNGKDLFGPGFWLNKKAGVWGISDQITAIFIHGGNIRATSVVPSSVPSSRLADAHLKDVFESHFKTMYEIFDREQVFNSLNKYGMAILWTPVKILKSFLP